MGIPYTDTNSRLGGMTPLINPSTAAYMGLSNQIDQLCFDRLLNTESRIEAIAGHRYGQYEGPQEDTAGVLLGTVSLVDKGEHDLYAMGIHPGADANPVTLISCLKELFGSAALSGQGVPSTRSLALFTEPNGKPEAPAVLIRLAQSHLRFGQFEYLFHTQQHASLRRLMDDCIERFLPQYIGLNDRYEQLFYYIIQHTAKLLGAWQSSGFTHGLMHTDNMSICGETFYWGAHTFMTSYQPTHLSNPVDHLGRYAFHMQTNIAYWNLQMLAKTFTNQVPMPTLSHHLDQYEATVNQTFTDNMHNKFGLCEINEQTKSLIEGALSLMASHSLDYHRFFYSLSQLENRDGEEKFLAMQAVKETSATNPKHEDELLCALDIWLAQYKKTIHNKNDFHAMKSHNPLYVPRPSWIQHCVENPEDIHNILKVLNQPYMHHDKMDAWLLTACHE